MSTTIDQRIVEMRFDNKRFEQNCSETMSTLDKLKQKLRFDGAAKGFEDISSASRKVDMTTLGNSVEKVGLKFSGLYTIADQALRNITNSAMNAGTRIVKALTIDPVKTGFSEYETQINAIQTILANTESKGTTLADVNGALDELNAYADKTIYNFTEMTRNIGTFTAAGVDLDTSVSAIKGIANLAAVSGSTSQQASTAMYQLSQALASGTVKLMDWNSVVNAGMGGQVFQDALKETARVHGIAIDELIKQEGSFRETLSHGWLSSEILTETLSKFTGDLNAEQLKTMGYTEKQIEGILKMGQTANDAATKVKTFSQLLDTLKEAAQSGWSQTWEIVVGDFEEAKALLTQVSDTLGGIIGKSAESRNDLLENWKVLGGRTELIDAFKYAFEGVMSIVQAVSEAMNEVFPPLTAEKLVAFCKGLKELAQRFAEVFKVNGKTTTTFNNLKRTLAGVFAVVDIVRQVFVAFAKILGKVLGVTGKFGGGLLHITAVIGDWLVAIRDALEYSGILEGAITGVGKILEFVVGIFKNFGRTISESFVFKAATEGLNAFLNLIHQTKDGTDILADAATNVKAAWEGSGLYKVLVNLWDILKAIGTGISRVFKGVFGTIFEELSEGNLEGVIGLLNGLLSGGLIVGLMQLVKGIKDVFGSAGDIIESFQNILDNVGNAFKAFQNKLNADALKSIATAIAILVGSLVVLTFIDEDELSRSLAALVVVMGMMTLMMKVLDTGNSLSGSIKKGEGLSFDAESAVGSIVKLAAALLIAAAALKLVGNMEWEDIGQGLVGLLGVFAILTAVELTLSYFSKGSKKAQNGAKVMRSMAITLLLVCAPLAIIGAMDSEALKQGLLGILAILSGMALVQIAFSHLAKGGSKVSQGATSMLIMAAAINLLIPPLLVFALLPSGMLLQSVLALAGVLVALALVQVMYTRLASNTKKMLVGALSIALIAASIKMLLPTLILFAVLPLDAVLKSVLSLVAILGAFALVQVMYTKLASSATKMIKGAAAIAIIAASLNLILPVLLTLSNMELESLASAGVGLVGILAILGSAIVLLSKFGGSAAKMSAAATAIATVSGALSLLGWTLTKMGAMEWYEALTAIVMLASTLGLIVGVAYMLKPVVGVLNSFGIAVALVGAGILAAGAGLILFGIGLGTIAVGVTKLVGSLAVLVGGLGGVAVALVVLVAAVVEGIIRGIGSGIVALCDILIESLPLIADVCIELVIALCDVLIACVPKLVDTVLIIVLELCRSFVQFVPPIVEALVQLIIGVLNALTKELPGLIKAVVDLLFAFVEGVINALGGMDASRLTQALMNVSMLGAIVAILAAMKFLAPAAMAGVLLMGVVVAELALVLAALGGIASIPGLTDLIGSGGNLLQAIGTAIGQFVGGLVGGFAKGATADLPEIASNLAGFADNIGGFLDIAPKLANSMSSLAGASIATSIADFFNLGGSGMDVFAEELPKLGEGLSGFSDAIGTRSFDNIGAAVEGLKGLSDIANAIPNSGGLVGAITGENSIAAFGDELVDLGEGLAGFSDAIGDRSFDKVAGAVTAAGKLAELANIVPNSGGMVSWFTGENSLSKFGDDIVNLGKGIRGFADEVGEVPDITSAITAAESLVQLTNKIPNEGGIVSWFTGSSSISKFSNELGNLGTGINEFATNIGDADPEKIKAAAIAAQSIAQLTEYIPKEEGIAQWFTGESSLSKFGNDIGELGKGLNSFAVNTKDVVPDKVKAAAEAAKVLASICEYTPKEDGIAQWFGGETSLSKFAEDMGNLGMGLNKFASNTGDINPDTVKPAAEAAKVIASITEHVPTEGGIGAWFSGEKSLSKFADDMGSLGTGLNSFAVNTGDIVPDQVKAAADAAKAIAEITQFIPNEDGIVHWFTGTQSISKFADQLPRLGTGLAGFANGLGDASVDKIKPAAEAAKALAEMTQFVPSSDGIAQWFTGETSISKFAGQLPKLGSGMLEFSKSVEGMSPENVEAASTAAKKLAEMTQIVPGDSRHILTFGDNLGSFGTKLNTFVSNTKHITEASVAGSKVLIEVIKDITTIDSSKISAAATALNDLTKAAKNMEKDIKSSMKDAGKKAVEGYVKGITDNASLAEDAAEDLVDDAAVEASDSASSFETAGKDCVEGFANGILNNKYLATDAGSAVGKAALEAAKEAVDSNSPSKEFMKLGRDSDIGFANGLNRYADMVYDSGYEVGRSGVKGLGDSISKISRLVENGMDTQPTIRPVLDLGDVENGVSRIGGLFANTPFGVKANLGAISNMMNSRTQNGSNKDVTDAIKELRADIKKIKTNTYNVNGITYDDGSNVADAVRTLIRAAIIERRV